MGPPDIIGGNPQGVHLFKSFDLKHPQNQSIISCTRVWKEKWRIPILAKVLGSHNIRGSFNIWGTKHKYREAFFCVEAWQLNNGYNWYIIENLKSIYSTYKPCTDWDIQWQWEHHHHEPDSQQEIPLYISPPLLSIWYSGASVVIVSSFMLIPKYDILSIRPSQMSIFHTFEVGIKYESLCINRMISTSSPASQP